MKIKTHGNLWLTKNFATMLHKTFYTDAKSKTIFLCFNWNNYNKVSAFIIFRIAKTLGFFASWYYNSYQKLKFSLIRYPQYEQASLLLVWFNCLALLVTYLYLVENQIYLHKEKNSLKKFNDEIFSNYQTSNQKN